MNILGHSYVATKVVSGNRKLLIAGSLLPECFPFIEGNPFSFEEIHEGGERLLEFLDRNYAGKRDLALGMLAHSKEFGADGFNKEVEEYAGSQREALLKKIAECSGVDLKIAQFRLHNFLWWGVDVEILRQNPDLVEDVQSVIKTVDVEGVSSSLSGAFGREEGAVERVVRVLFRDIYRPEDLTSVEGLARIWVRQAAGLPEKDRVDIGKAAELFEECAGLMENHWRGLVKTVETKVGENLRPFVSKEGIGKRNKEQEI